MAADIDPPIGEDDLHALVDGALDPARQAAVRRYLAERPGEAARVRAFAAQRDALRDALAFKAAEPIPPRLRLSHLRAARRQALLRRLRAGAAAAAVLLAGIGLGWTVRGTLDRDTAPAIARPAEPAVLHRLAAGPSPVQEAAAARTDIAAWLAVRLGGAMPVPDLSEFAFTLDLARVVPAAEGAAAMLRYVDAEGAEITFWRRPSPDPVPRELRCADQPGGVVTYSWSDGAHLHLVGAALPRERLRPIALALERAMREPSPQTGLMAALPRRPCEGALG